MHAHTATANGNHRVPAVRQGMQVKRGEEGARRLAVRSGTLHAKAHRANVATDSDFLDEQRVANGCHVALVPILLLHSLVDALAVVIVATASASIRRRPRGRGIAHRHHSRPRVTGTRGGTAR